MPAENIKATDPARLAELLKISDTDGKLWRPEELGAILRHQLNVPVEFDLHGMGDGDARRARMSAESQGLLLRSFGDLLRHMNPPLELLVMTKEFAKANRRHPDSGLPWEIATVLYFASIAVALVRCKQRITQLDNLALSEGFAWAQQQDWVDEETRTLLCDGAELLCDDRGHSRDH